MTPEARRYYLGDNRESFSAFSMTRHTAFCFDDLQAVTHEFSPRVTHQQKSCELSARKTLTYLVFPFSPTSRTEPRIVSSVADLPRLPRKSSTPATAALRISVSKRGLSSKLLSLMNARFRRQVFDIIESGRRRVNENLSNDGRIVAELEKDLVAFRHNEIDGLDQIASHLQSIFDDCECSIFLAQRELSCTHGTKKYSLRAAATTCQSTSIQHAVFRSTFFDNDNYYECTLDENDDPAVPRDQWAKTEHAFYSPEEQIFSHEDTISRKYAGKGEVSVSGSFMAIAIPSRNPADSPYGVIRLVTESPSCFTERHRTLADAIAEGLSIWMDFFPKNENLKLTAEDDIDVSELIASIDPRLDPVEAEKELAWLFQKLFADADAVRIIDVASRDESRAAFMLLVQGEHGREFLVTCASKAGSLGIESGEGVRETKYLVGRRRRLPGMESEEHAYIVRRMKNAPALGDVATSLMHLVGPILEAKLPGVTASIRVERSQRETVLVIETTLDSRDAVERILDQYGQVIRKETDATEFLDDRFTRFTLETELEHARRRVEFYNELYGDVQTNFLQLLNTFSQVIRSYGSGQEERALDKDSSKSISSRIDTLESRIDTFVNNVAADESILDELKDVRRQLGELSDNLSRGGRIKGGTWDRIQKVVSKAAASAGDLEKTSTGTKRAVQDLLATLSDLGKFFGDGGT